MTEDEFISEEIEGLRPPLDYFVKNAADNRHGYESIDEIMNRSTEALNPDAFELVANTYGALIMRSLGYLKGGFANWTAVGKEVDSIETIVVPTFERQLLREGDVTEVLDVRKRAEFYSRILKPHPYQ